MTTERLSILAAAAALGEFTATELAAYTGANPSTVRQVLKREQESRQLFRRTKRRPPRGGRPAQVWQLTDPDAIFDEIAEEEAKVAALQSSTVRRELHAISPSDEDRTDVYLTSAEEAVIRSYETDNKREKESFARIALNLLQAADPRQTVVDDQKLDDNWWDRGSESPQRHDYPTLTPLESVSRARIGAALPSFRDSYLAARDSGFEFARRRAQRIAAFASLAVSQAEELPVELDDLTRAAEAISEGSRVLPEHQTLLWVKIFVNISIKSVNAPPVAVLTTSERPPYDLFPVTRSDWHQLKIPSELADTGYRLWVERWAESLLTSNLIPGVVVSHDNSPASNKALSQLMTASASKTPGRAVVIASTVEDFQVVARLAASGGTYYPMLQNTVEGLLPTVSRVVAEAVNSLPPDFIITRWAAEVSRYMPELYMGALGRRLIHAMGPMNIQLSDIEITNKVLTALNSAIADYRNLATEQKPSHAELVKVFNRLAAQLPDPGESQDAVAAVHASIIHCRRIIELKTDFLDTEDLEDALALWPGEENQHEARSAFAWAYEEYQDDVVLESSAPDPDTLLTRRDRKIIDLLANKESVQSIAKALGTKPRSVKRRIAVILQKLGLESTDQITESISRREYSYGDEIECPH